jgi:uncharacterized protein
VTGGTSIDFATPIERWLSGWDRGIVALVTELAAGWYPVDDRTQRYWDGTTWTEHVAPLTTADRPMSVDGSGTSDDRTMALLAHVSAVFTGFVGPLIVWAIKKDESEYVAYHAREALNFQITLFFAWMVCVALMFVLVGFLLLPVLFIVQLVAPILGAVAANKGEYFRYPLTLRLVS